MYEHYIYKNFLHRILHCILYILLERWVAGTPAHGRDRGRASGRGRLSHAGTSRWPSSPQQPRWQCDNLLRQMVTEAGEPSDGGAGPLHQARDLSLWFSWREKTLHRQSFDEFPELSTGTRLSLLSLSEPILTLQLRASLDTACFNRKSKLCLLEHLTFPTFLVMEQSSMLWRTQPLNLPKFHRLLFPAGGNMRRFCASYVESSLKREVWNWVKSANDNIGHRMPAGLPSKILSIPSGS